MLFLEPCSFAFVFCLFSTVLAASIPETFARYCDTKEPSSALRFAHTYLAWAEPRDNEYYNASIVDERILHRKQKRYQKREAFSPVFTIDTYIHIVADSESAQTNSSAYVTDSQIRAQFEYLVNSYADVGIGFRLRGYSRVTNDTWAENGDDLAMKQALRKGTYSTLNIYYQSRLQTAPGSPDIDSGSVLLGFCSLPGAGVRETTPAAAYVFDGCNILSATMPGGSISFYNLGGSTVHEVGHWTGLLHTFEGYTCNEGDYGDYVADTPQQSTSTNGCPRAKDTCPNSGAPAGFDGSDGEFSSFFFIIIF